MVNDEPVIDPAALLVPEFKAIWDRDKKKGKIRARQELAYVYFMADPRSPYADEHYLKKESIIKMDCFNDVNYEIDSIILTALSKYKELYETPTMRFLQGIKIQLDNLAEYLKETKPIDGKGGNFNSILSTITKGKELITTADSLEELVNKKIRARETKKRGSVTPNMFDLEK